VIANRLLFLFVVGAALIVAGDVVGADSFPPSVPAKLQGMPSEIRETASNIQRIVIEQHGMIERARQVKTPEEREEVFRAIANNVQDIAQKRVAVMEHYTKRARERVDWARKHAANIQVSDLVHAMGESAALRPPRSPFVVPTNDARARDLPKTVQSVRSRLEKTMTRLRSLGEECKQARTDEQREKIKCEIAACLRTIEEERVTVLEAVLKTSEKRLRWARQRATETGS
jgi:hypothetical protein